jgi:hypothetical protein
MGAVVAEDAPEGKGPQPVRRAESSGRQPVSAEPTGPMPRFFLAKPGANGSTPSCDRELANEAEAMIESLKSGLNYYSVVEYRVISDCSGRQPVVKKEAVRKSSKLIARCLRPTAFTEKRRQGRRRGHGRRRVEMAFEWCERQSLGGRGQCLRPSSFWLSARFMPCRAVGKTRKESKGKRVS